jgi:glycosyltransferase involved in cell wall biosynthesis
MIAGRRVVVVVPACEEELLVGRVIRTMPAFVDRIVVIDDGSRDRTSAEAKAPGDPRVEVIRHARRRGVGAAIATGYRYALGVTDHPNDAVAVMAGDGQMDPADLERVVSPLVRGEAEYVKGDRFGDPSTRSAMGLPRWIGGQVFSRLTGLAIGRRVNDSQCGYTAIARYALSGIDLDGLWPSFGYPNDLLGILAVRGMRITEVPVRAVYGSERSKLRLRHLPPIFFLVARAALRRQAATMSRHPFGEATCAHDSPYHLEETGCERRGPRPAQLEVSEP